MWVRHITLGTSDGMGEKFTSWLYCSPTINITLKQNEDQSMSACQMTVMEVLKLAETGGFLHERWYEEPFVK